MANLKPNCCNNVSVFIFSPPAKFHFVKPYSKSISKFQNTGGEKFVTLTNNQVVVSIRLRMIVN